MEQEVERPVKGPLTRRRSGAVSTPERVLRSRTDKSDGSPPTTAATALREGTPSRASTPKREGTPKRALKKPVDNVTETPTRRSVRASSAQPEDSPANKRVLSRRRSTSLQPETPKKEDKTIATRSKLSTVASEKTVPAVSTRSRRSIAPAVSASSEPSTKVSPEPVKEIKRVTRRSASNSPAREIAKAAGVKATRRSSLVKTTDTSPVGSPDPETSSDKTPSLIPRKRHVRNLGLSPVEENKDEATTAIVSDSSNTDVKSDITDPKVLHDITAEPTQSTELISDSEVVKVKVEQVSPVRVQTLNVQSLDSSVKSEVLSPNGSTSHDKNESCAESEDSGIKEMEEFNSLEDKGLDKVSSVISDQVDIGSEVYEDQNNDPNSKLIQTIMADKGKTVKGLDKKTISYKENLSKLKTVDNNSSRYSPVVSLVRLNADNIPEISHMINVSDNLASLDKTESIDSNFEEKTQASPLIKEDKNKTLELVSGEGLPDNKISSKVAPLMKIASAFQNLKSTNDSITDQLLSERIDEDAAKVEKSSANTSKNVEGNKIDSIKEQSESAQIQITPDGNSAKVKSEHIEKSVSETTVNEDLDFTLKIDTETETGKTNPDDTVKEVKSKSVDDVLSHSVETEISNTFNNDILTVPIKPDLKSAEINFSLTTEVPYVQESPSASSNIEVGSVDVSGDKTDLSTAPLSPSKSQCDVNHQESSDLSYASQGNIVEKSDEHPMEDLKGDCSDVKETSVEDSLNNSQVDTNYSLLVNVSYDSVTDKKEDSKSSEAVEEMDITSGEITSSKSKTTDEEKNVNHPIVEDEEKSKELEDKDENDEAPEHLDASLVSDDSFIAEKVTRAKETSPILRRSRRESERRESSKRSCNEEESTTKIKHSAKLLVSADESSVSGTRSSNKEASYYPDCSMISDDSFDQDKDDSTTPASHVATEKMDHPTISCDPIEKNDKVQETGEIDKSEGGELDDPLVLSEANEPRSSMISTHRLVEGTDATKPLEETSISEESKPSLIPDKSAEQESTKRNDENQTLLDHPDESVSTKASNNISKNNKSKPVICPSTSEVEMSAKSDEICVGHESNKQSIDLSGSFGDGNKTIMENKSKDKTVDQSSTLTEMSGITYEPMSKNQSEDKPVEQSIVPIEGSSITDETMIVNKSVDQSITLMEIKSGEGNQSLTLMESSGISDENLAKHKSDDNPMDQSLTPIGSSTITDETMIENKSDGNLVGQSLTLMESSRISDETMIENNPVYQSTTLIESSGITEEAIGPVDKTVDLSKSSAILDDNKSDDKSVEQSVTQSESAAFCIEIAPDNKSEDKPVDQSVTQTESSEIAPDNKSEEKPVDQSVTQTESSEIAPDNKSEEKPVEQSVTQTESSEIAPENKSDKNSVEPSITEIEKSVVSDETGVESKADEKSVTDSMDSLSQAQTTDICKDTKTDHESENSGINSSNIQTETSSATDKSLVQSKSTNDQATSQVQSSIICGKNQSICDNLEVSAAEISGDSNEKDKTKKETVENNTDEDNSFNICDGTLVSNKSTDEFDNFTGEADASSIGSKTLVQEETGGKSVSEVLETSTSQTDISGVETKDDTKLADDLNQSGSNFEYSSVCDKSVGTGDSSIDTLEYPNNQGDISGTGDETMETLEQPTNDVTVKEQLDTSGVCQQQQQPAGEKTSENASKDKSPDELNKVISIDDTTNESQEPFIEGDQPAVQTAGEEINPTVSLSGSESQEVFLVKSSSESCDSELIKFPSKKAAKEETGNDKNIATSKQNDKESQSEEESRSESSSSYSEEDGSSSSSSEEFSVSGKDFLDDEAEEGEETESSDATSVEDSRVSHIQKNGIPKLKRQFVVNDESSESQSSESDSSGSQGSELWSSSSQNSESQSSSEDLTPQAKKRSRPSSKGHSNDQNVDGNKKSIVPCASETDKKDKKRTLIEDTKSSDQKKIKVRKSTPSVQPVFDVLDSNNENLVMDRDPLENIEFRVRKCSDTYLTHRLADNVNNSHATGGVFKITSQSECLKPTGRRTKKKISCNVNFKVEKYCAQSPDLSADRSYFCGIKFDVTQKKIRKRKSISAGIKSLPENDESLESMGKLKRRKDSSSSSSRVTESDFNLNSNNVEAKGKRTKRKLGENLQLEDLMSSSEPECKRSKKVVDSDNILIEPSSQPKIKCLKPSSGTHGVAEAKGKKSKRKPDENLQLEELHSITLHDSSSDPESSYSKEVDPIEYLSEQHFVQPKIKCPKPCYSATIQNLGTGINALDLFSLFSKLDLRGIEDIDLSTCPPRLFCKKLGYGNIRFSHEEAMQECVDMSRKIKLRGEELWVRACYCYRPLNKKASQWLTQSNQQFSQKKLKYLRKQKKSAQT